MVDDSATKLGWYLMVSRPIKGRTTKGQFLVVSDLGGSLNNLRCLRNLMRSFNKYHVRDVETPSLNTLTSGRYKALAYNELTPIGAEWKTAFLFRVGRDRHDSEHVVVSVDHILIDPSSKMSFVQVGKFVRLISQYVLGKIDVRRIDLIIHLDGQLNPHVKTMITNALKAEGMSVSTDGSVLFKKIRDIDPETGRNMIGIPLPALNPQDVRGMTPMVASDIAPIKINDGGVVQFASHIKLGSKQHKALLQFCLEHRDWVYPVMDVRTSYMETLFTREKGDIPRWVESLVMDAQFIIIVNGKGMIQAFMAFIPGYSIPSLTTWTNDAGSNGMTDGYYVNPERTVFVPVLVCECMTGQSNRGTGRKSRPGVWTRAGLQQALAMWKMLLTVISDPLNRRKFSVIAAQTTRDGFHAHLLDALGMSLRGRFSNLPYYPEDTEIYARMIY